jgi:hypothetical protein
MIAHLPTITIARLLEIKSTRANEPEGSYDLKVKKDVYSFFLKYQNCRFQLLVKKFEVQEITSPNKIS